MKLLIAGDWGTDIFEEPLAQAFEKEGFDVIKFKWNKYFSELLNKGYIFNIISRIQYKYMFGPLVKKLNIDLFKKVREKKPNILFVYRGSHIYSATLKKLKQSILIFILLVTITMILFQVFILGGSGGIFSKMF